MNDLQVYITLGVFAAVILAIAFNLVDMALAVMLGASVLLALGILTQQDILNSFSPVPRRHARTLPSHGRGCAA
mgnify:CR=1 FL=1